MADSRFELTKLDSSQEEGPDEQGALQRNSEVDPLLAPGQPAPPDTGAINNTAERSAEEERALDLKYGADQVLALILPVSLCMAVVILTIKTVAYYSENDAQFVYSPYREESSDSSSERLGGALLNVIIIIGIIVVMTFLLVILFKYRCMRAIHGWLVLSSLLLLYFFTYDFVMQVLNAHNVTLDYITLALTIWNFGSVGMIVIHWRGPLLLQQCYLIAVSSLMALTLIKYLPEWTTWLLLGCIAIYDLIAVLCPGGPLRMLVEMAQERGEPLFAALVYSSTSTMAWTVNMADAPRRAASAAYSPLANNDDDAEDDDELLTPQLVQSPPTDPNDSEDAPTLEQGSASAPTPASGLRSRPSTTAAAATAAPATSAPSRATAAAAGPSQSARAAPAAVAASSNAPTRSRAAPRPTAGQQARAGGVSGEGGETSGRAGAQARAPQARQTQAQQQQQEEEEEEASNSGVKLGLGDFIFYSVLVGKAATSQDWGTIFVCYVAILIGLAATLLLLSIMRHALPALPISITLGLIFYFSTSDLLTPFLDNLSVSQVFV